MVRRVDSLHRISCTLLLLLATTGLPSALGKWRPVHSKHALAGIAAEREDRSSARLSAGGDRTPLAPQGVVVDQFGELVDLTVPVDDEEFDDPLPVRTTLAQHGDPPASAGAGSLERSHAEGVAEHSKLKSGARYCTNANFNQVGWLCSGFVLHHGRSLSASSVCKAVSLMSESGIWCPTGVKLQWQLGGSPHRGVHWAV